MSKILGYGEDALTFWFLKTQTETILNYFGDKTDPSDCLAFHRPSFGRGSNRTYFGEFDAIFASRENVYLIESKWDNHTITSRSSRMLRPEQTARHEVFRWYLSNWSDRYSNRWASFIGEKGASFPAIKKIAPEGTLLATNLQQILGKLQQHCPSSSSKEHIKNVLLFFHSANSSPPSKTSEGFEIVPVEYPSRSNYINLF